MRRGVRAVRVVVVTAGVLIAALGVAEPLREPLEAKLERLEGGSERLSELRGKRLLLDLWATWCEPCRAQTAIVREVAAAVEEAKVEVLAVNVGENRKTVERFVAATPPHGRLLLDRGQRIPAQLGIEALPALILVGEDGSALAVREGLVERGELLALLATAFAMEQKDSPGAPP